MVQKAVVKADLSPTMEFAFGKLQANRLCRLAQQATGNRQQATGNRQQATGNRQQATGNYTHLLINRVNNPTVEFHPLRATFFIKIHNFSFIGGIL